MTTLIEQLAAKPHLTTAGVLERWRDHRFFPRLEALASAESLIDGSQAVAELSGILDKLSKEETAHRRAELVEKSKHEALDESEQRELAKLLASRLPADGTKSEP